MLEQGLLCATWIESKSPLHLAITLTIELENEVIKLNHAYNT